VLVPDDAYWEKRGDAGMR